MKHLKLFETEAEFEAAKDKIEEPWVVLVEGNEKVHYGVDEHVPSSLYLQCWLNVTDTTNITPLIYSMRNVSKVLLDGEEISLVDYEGVGYGYLFNQSGNVKLDIELTDNTYLENDMFYGDDWYYEDWRSKSTLGKVIIPNSVTNIGNNAFAYSHNLTNIEIPNSVTSIGEEAFWDCRNLTNIEIPNSVTSIGSGAFAVCSSLTSIEIPNSVTSIGDGAFQNCSSLTSIEIPNSVTSIGGSAFYICGSLTSITYDGTIEEWNAITKGIIWKTNVPSTCEVHCTDGDIAIADA